MKAGFSTVVFCDSQQVAAIFGKQHAHVLRDIDTLNRSKSGLSEGFRLSNFGFTYYRDDQGKRQRKCLLSKDGFTVLAMGYRGQKAMQFKEAFMGLLLSVPESILSDLLNAEAGE